MRGVFARHARLTRLGGRGGAKTPGRQKTDRQTDSVWILKRLSVPLVLRVQMSERATCWSITINNPTEEEMKPILPAKWMLTGQMEAGAEGTLHYQAMLKTPQVRFSAVKQVFPRAHIEVARNVKALEQYCHKEESRVGLVPDRVSNIPTLFDYIHTIAKRFDSEEYALYTSNYPGKKEEDTFMGYIDYLVDCDIQSGKIGVEIISINPMWRSAWKRHGRSMIMRETKLALQTADRQTDNQEPVNEIIYPPAEN